MEKRGKPKGKSDCIFVKIDDFLKAGYSANFAIKVSRRWLEDIGFQIVSSIEPPTITEVEPESDQKVEFSVHVV